MRIKLSQAGLRLSILVGILAAMIASGCASPATARLVAHTKTTASYTVTINFDSDRCPDSVSPPVQVSCTVPAQGFCAKPGRAVQWVSSPAGTPFEVYFDPFVGRPYASHGTDQKTSAIVVRRGTLEGLYKYSIVGLVCSVDAKAVLDPPLRVEY